GPLLCYLQRLQRHCLFQRRLIMTKAAAIQELSDEPGAEELSLLLKKALSLLSTIPSCLRVFVENEHLPMFLENFQKSATELRALTRTARELLTDQVKIDFARA